MKQNFMTRGMGVILDRTIRRDIPHKAVRKAVRAEYDAVLARASDIGSSNRLLSSYALAAWFIAMDRNTGLTPEENIRILEVNLRRSFLLKHFMGNAKSYFSQKHIDGCREWSKETHKEIYPNDWVVDVVDGGKDFRFGFDYTQCGVCKLCRDEGCPQLARYLCSLDFMLVEIIGVGLRRTTTLAEGGSRCDFRFYEK